MKRFWIILLAIAMALVIALPATAVKPIKPEKTPTLFDVTFKFSGELAGFDSTTDCTTSDVITMEAGPANRLLAGAWSDAADVPLLQVNLPSVDWYRYYPYYPDPESVLDDFDPSEYPTVEAETGSGIQGCHGGGIELVTRSWDEDLPLTIDQRPGFLMLQVGSGTVDFAWNADYYFESDAAMPRNPRQDPKVTMTAWEHFRFESDALVWDGEWDKTKASTGTVTGEISVLYVTPYPDYPVFTGSPLDVEFTMTITPHK